MKTFKHTLAALALCGLFSPAMAETAQDARTLLDAAMAEIKARGLEGAQKVFNAGGKWRQGTMYLVMADFKGNMLVHSANEKIVGKNMYEAKDAAGLPFVQEVIKSVQATGEAKVNLRWANPTTKKLDDGHMLARRVPGQSYYLGAVFFE
ncbi:MAG: cache domain-containing protein [Burkholderiaceae bacterium]|nr:cache domain-containing protein [Burkholderiaceae bacterium]